MVTPAPSAPDSAPLWDKPAVSPVFSAGNRIPPIRFLMLRLFAATRRKRLLVQQLGAISAIPRHSPRADAALDSAPFVRLFLRRPSGHH